MTRVCFIVLVLLCFQGCFSARWEIRQIETTFVNQENNQEYVQKNAVLVNGHTGQTWVFSSDRDSHYYWIEMPVLDRESGNLTPLNENE